jgi:predicted nucleotidyltransferase
VNAMQKKKFRIPRKKISEFCRRWGVVEFSLFGSALRADFRPDSDVDVLVTFSRDAQISLFDLVQMKLDLEKIFHRPVDIIEKDALENPFRKREILRTAQVIYFQNNA